MDEPKTARLENTIARAGYFITFPSLTVIFWGWQ
jgi:hypothetical protein